MSRIEFISHEEFPEDEYNKEVVYLSIDKLHRVLYVRKKSKDGGLFWSVVTLGITKNGRKEYYPSYMQDSNFLEKDIKDYLEKRKWQLQKAAQDKPEPFPNPLWQPKPMEEPKWGQGSMPQMQNPNVTSQSQSQLPF